MTAIAAGDITLEIDGLDPEVARRLLADRAVATRGNGARAAPGRNVLVWTLGAEQFALPLGDVALVLKAGRTTPVPGAPPALIGLASRRGRLLNVVDPAPALGQSESGSEAGHLLVLKGTRPRLAMLVDRADAVTSLAADEGSADADGADRRLTRQVALAGGGRLLLVDKDRLVEALGLAGPQRGM